MTRLAMTLSGLLLVAAAAATPAGASAPEAWDALRASVSAACLKAAAPLLPGAKAQVDPFGSESYGLALLTGTPKGGKQPVMIMCVYDKRSGTVQIGSEMPLPR
ncbi:MAG: hypothetical protein AB1592_14575 [Pseudomonadota bacterium]